MRGYAIDPGLPCANVDCDRTSTDGRLAKGFCNQHYLAQYHGRKRFGPTPQYLPDANGCWIWQRGTTRGYPKYDRARYGHRVYYEWLVGPIPEGMTLDHLCRVPLCVNPQHLEPVTAGENARRGHTRLACRRGHFFTPENTYRRPDNGQRQCRACIEIRWRRVAYLEHVERVA